jgi:hypothetical protein
MIEYGTLPKGVSYRRSISVDYMYHNDDGSVQKNIQMLAIEETVLMDKKKKKRKNKAQ